MSWRMYFDNAPWNYRCRLAILNDIGRCDQSNRGFRVGVVQPVTIKAKEEGCQLEEDDWAFSFTGDEWREFLQAWADLAWDNGIKPRNLHQSDTEREAIRYHLEDMRRLVLKDSYDRPRTD